MKDTLYGAFNGCQYLATALQTDKIFQIIQLALSILTTLILCVLKIISWAKKAKADGKIDKEEIDEAIDIIKDAADDIEAALPKDGGKDTDNGEIHD